MNVSARNVRRQLEAELRVQASLDEARGLDREETLAARWERRRCLELDEAEVDRQFFNGRTERSAVAYCNGCVARVQCALRALEEDARSNYPPAGVFGGLTAQERAQATFHEELSYVG